MPAADPILIVIADDSPGDRLLAIKALQRGGIDNPVLQVEDGQQLLDRRGVDVETVDVEVAHRITPRSTVLGISDQPGSVL